MKNGTIHAWINSGKPGNMQNLLIMTEKIRNEEDLLTARENLKTIYREIIRLVIKKEEFEERIEEYLNRK
jgi:hypothetical protein